MSARKALEGTDSMSARASLKGAAPLSARACREATRPRRVPHRENGRVQ